MPSGTSTAASNAGIGAAKVDDSLRKSPSPPGDSCGGDAGPPALARRLELLDNRPPYPALALEDLRPAYRTVPCWSGTGGAATADDKRRPNSPRPLVGDQLPSPRLSQLEVLEALPPLLLPDEARPTYPPCPPPAGEGTGAAEDHKRVSPKTDDAVDVRRPSDDSCCKGCAACAPSS